MGINRGLAVATDTGGSDEAKQWGTGAFATAREFGPFPENKQPRCGAEAKKIDAMKKNGRHPRAG